MQMWDETGICDVTRSPRWWEKEGRVINFGRIEFIKARQARLERKFHPGDFVRSSKWYGLLKVVRAKIMVLNTLVYNDEKWLQCVDSDGRIRHVPVATVTNHLRLHVSDSGQKTLTPVETKRAAGG
jgi:hypothetical protein